MRKPNPFREELTLSRSQRKKQTIVDKLNDMSADWADYHGCLETDFYLLAFTFLTRKSLCEIRYRDGDREVAAFIAYESGK